MTEKTNENMFSNTLSKFKEMNLLQKVFIGILITIISSIIVGLFVMSMKVYSFDVDMCDIKQDMKEKASKDYVDQSINTIGVGVGANGDKIQSIKEDDIKEIKDGIKNLNSKFDNVTLQLNSKMDENQKFIIEYINKIN